MIAQGPRIPPICLESCNIFLLRLIHTRPHARAIPHPNVRALFSAAWRPYERMRSMTTATGSAHSRNYLDRLEGVVKSVIAPAAAEIDRTGSFPRTGMEALGKAGLL